MQMRTACPLMANLCHPDHMRGTPRGRPSGEQRPGGETEVGQWVTWDKDVWKGPLKLRSPALREGPVPRPPPSPSSVALCPSPSRLLVLPCRLRLQLLLQQGRVPSL